MGDVDGEHADDDADGDVLAEILPVPDRCVLFLADLRCPHEVLPVTRKDGERYSAITWYTTEEDVRAVPLTSTLAAAAAAAVA